MSCNHLHIGVHLAGDLVQAVGAEDDKETVHLQ